MPLFDQGKRPRIVFLTVCSKGRAPVMANDLFVEALRSAWREADHWQVGRWLVMPDHVHLFCAPGVVDAPPVGKCIRHWKSVVSRSLREGKLEGFAWQRDFWDTQLRSGDSYSEKWAYVEMNPVRAGLVERPENWRWQGEENVLFGRE
ncbi:transposase [Pelagicoccus enzymogenes]|uniref:REP-associated tyrosine transposase n=1 Tax=Pelagicoccus enzymogenes TaxID=2773457 RepID=UPI0028104709|nr:transposase [Pelagicoccus enzymogenes]MDQ8197476.1 transposase [Pelagicoccus enzymogenes]